MGVSGAGKTAAGKLLAPSLELPFYDADDFHPQSNVTKMRSGVPLTDEDRKPWLEILARKISGWGETTGAVLACSALKQSYRDILRKDNEGVQFVFLKANAELIQKRFTKRRGHYMPDSLIQSQFDSLEPPQNAIYIRADQTLDQINEQIIGELENTNKQLKQTTLCDLGVVGLGVMGVSLARNLAGNDNKVAIINPQIPGEEHVTQQVYDKFPEAGFIPASDYKNFVHSIAKPATILLMVKAGQPVDDIIDELLPHLNKDSIIIDGGNSFYKDTQRRTAFLATKGIHFVGMGVSGGEAGALNGPAMMPGGDELVKKKILQQFSPIAAKSRDGKPCINWIGPDGAGHFVKMIHNGIEYAEMQLIAEIYDILKKVYGLGNEAIADVFTEFAAGELESYLLTITADIVRHQENGDYVIDQILDVAGQKGTGKWSVQAGLEYSVAIPSISAAVDARILSACTHRSLIDNDLNAISIPFGSTDIKLIKEALFCAKVLVYDQGFRLLKAASKKHNWQLNLQATAATWRGGCIIRSAMLETMMRALEESPANDGLLHDHYFQSKVVSNMEGLSQLIEHAMHGRIPTPALSSTLSYFLTLNAADLPVNLTQAQRDYFGAHTYEKKDEPRGKFYHTDWDK